jgi:hypothetical protein
VPTPSSRDNPAIKYTMTVHIVVCTKKQTKQTKIPPTINPFFSDEFPAKM